MSQAIHALRHHWPEYLIEAWGLGMFMVSAGVVVTLLEYPDSPVQQMIADSTIRRALVGLAMGLTAIGIIYSPWGQQSGAHINPAVTLAFMRLGKVAPWDAVFSVLPIFRAIQTAISAAGVGWLYNSKAVVINHTEIIDFCPSQRLQEQVSARSQNRVEEVRTGLGTKNIVIQSVENAFFTAHERE